MQKKIFIGFVLLFLELPVFFFDKGDVSLRENRTLEHFPSLTKENAINYKFGKDFETWFDDHFFKREQIIRLYSDVKHIINGVIMNEKAFIGDNGWIFEKNRPVETHSLEEQYKILAYHADVLRRFSDRFKDKGIPVYIVIIPNRIRVLKKHWEKYYKQKPSIDYGVELKKALADQKNITVIASENDFMNSPLKEQLYYKDDIHMTPEGITMIMENIYKELLKTELKGLPPSLKKKEIRYPTQRRAYLSSLLGKEGRVENITTAIEYLFPGYGKYEEVERKSYEKKTIDDGGVAGQVVYRIKGRVRSPAPSQKSFFSIGPCYAENVFELLKNVFKESVLMRTNMNDGSGTDATLYQIKEIRKLFDLKPNSAVIFITKDARDWEWIAFEEIYQAMER